MMIYMLGTLLDNAFDADTKKPVLVKVWALLMHSKSQLRMQAKINFGWKLTKCLRKGFRVKQEEIMVMVYMTWIIVHGFSFLNLKQDFKTINW